MACINVRMVALTASSHLRNYLEAYLEAPLTISLFLYMEEHILMIASHSWLSKLLLLSLKKQINNLQQNLPRMEEQYTANENVPKYKGVRKRKWGKWVSEIREPGKKTRIWLGSYEAPEMAAAAYDVAALHLRGPGARLNFPELLDSLPRPKSSRAEDVQLAAQQAAFQLRRPPASVDVGSSGANTVPDRVGLSPSQIQAINESPLDSPRMWMELAMGALLLEESHDTVLYHDNDVDHLSEWEEVQYESIWDS